jgi:hypothetical protein
MSIGFQRRMQDKEQSAVPDFGRRKEMRYRVSKRCQRLSAFNQIVAVKRERGKGREAATKGDCPEHAHCLRQVPFGGEQSDECTNQK